jgi:hypothetical protein
MRRILLAVCLLTVVFASLLAACSGGGKGNDSYAVSGTMLLGQNDASWTVGSACSGSGGYDDVTSGQQVVVTDQSQTVVGTGNLGDGKAVAVNGCQFSFKVPDLPKTAFYSVEVTHRGKTTYSFDDMQASGWHVALTLGDEVSLPELTPTAAPTDSGTPVPDPFASLQSYHYTMQMTGDGADSVTIKGSVKSPDSVAMDFYLAGSDTPVSSMIMIGTQAWSKSSTSGEWQPVDIAEAEGEVAGLLPKDFWGAFPFDQIISVSTDQGEETVNGVQAHHYQISEAGPETMAKLAEIFGSADQTSQPDKFSMDLWRAPDGWAVKAMISATYPEGSDITQAAITWEVSDVNSSAVSIEPPL